jgi:hypothetical protein
MTQTSPICAASGARILEPMRTPNEGGARRRIAFWIVAAVTLVVSHDLVYAARLRGLASRAAASRGPVSARAAHSFQRYLVLCARLFAVVALAFLVMENLEHFVSHGHLPGLGALLGPEYPLAIPVLAAASAVGAFLAGLVRERERALLARIAHVAAPPRRRSTAVARRRPQTERISWTSAYPARPGLGRAPPASF